MKMFNIKVILGIGVLGNIIDGLLTTLFWLFNPYSYINEGSGVFWFFFNYISNPIAAVFFTKLLAIFFWLLLWLGLILFFTVIHKTAAQLNVVTKEEFTSIINFFAYLLGFAVLIMFTIGGLSWWIKI